MPKNLAGQLWELRNVEPLFSSHNIAEVGSMIRAWAEHFDFLVRRRLLGADDDQNLGRNLRAFKS
jgi:hypothetical protein